MVSSKRDLARAELAADAHRYEIADAENNEREQGRGDERAYDEAAAERHLEPEERPRTRQNAASIRPMTK